jgi:hypothetical protein
MPGWIADLGLSRQALRINDWPHHRGAPPKLTVITDAPLPTVVCASVGLAVAPRVA